MPLIYAIEHKTSGFAYIGCTKGKLTKRMREHRCLLNQQKHLAGGKMQEDWDRDGEEGFIIKVVETLDENASVVDKRVRELYWMQVYQDKLYNANQVSFAPTKAAQEKGVVNAHNEPGERWTEEANRKRSEAQKGIPKGHGAKISETKQRNAFLRKIGLMI